MHRADRGSLLLIVAGALLLLAVVAYSINDAEDSILRKEAALRGPLAVPSQPQWSVAKAPREESIRTLWDRAARHGQHDEILKSLKRIEGLLERASSPVPGS